MIYIISVLAGLAYGCLFCWLNHRILMALVYKTDPNKDQKKAATSVMKAFVIRYFVIILALLTAFLACKVLPLNYIATIIAVAVGLTVPNQIWHITHDTERTDIWHNSPDANSKWQDDDKSKDENSSEKDDGWTHWDSWDD